MLALPSGFEACAREITHGDAAAPKQLPHLLLREGLIMAKRTRWTVFAVDHGELGSTVAVYDAIWEGLGTAGSRRLSVRREAGEYWVLVYKADSAIVDLSSLSQVARPQGRLRNSEARRRAGGLPSHRELCSCLVRSPGDHIEHACD